MLEDRARSAYACSCAEVAAPAEELESSGAVFVGVEFGLEAPDPGDNARFGGIMFEVSESWKGVSGDSVGLLLEGKDGEKAQVEKDADGDGEAEAPVLLRPDLQRVQPREPGEHGHGAGERRE